MDKSQILIIMKQKLFYIILLLIVSYKITSAQTNYNLSGLTLFDGEPYIAVNPANQNNIIAGWMRMRPDGKIWIATRASFDQGGTWSAINYMPHDTVINGSADVSIAFHSSGIAYLSWINFRTSPDTAGAIFVSKSVDGGLTWGTPNKVIDGTDKPDLPFDRPWIAVDNSGGINDGTIFVTAMSAYFYVGQHHIYLRTSNDNGLTWSTIKQIDTVGFSVGSLTVSYGGISIGSDGRAYMSFISYDVSVSPYVKYYSITTTDLGVTFDRNEIGTVFLAPGADFTKGWSLKASPTVAGFAVLTWVDKRYGDYDILLSKTMNGGINWSAPIKINDDARNNGVIQDLVWSDFSPSGNFGIAWRDRRLNGAGTMVPFDIYGAVSVDSANSFCPNFRVTSVSSPQFTVTKGNSFLGCAMSDSSICINWGDYRNSPDWDIYFNKTDIFSLFTSVKEITTTYKSIELYPNPANHSIQVLFSLPSDINNSNIVIFNSLGQVARIISVPLDQSGNYSQQIDISQFSNGIYYLFLKSKNTYLKNTTFIKE